MKLKGLLILMTIVLVKVCFAQDVSFKTAIPDFKIIETNISDEHSAFYYPVLMKRYKDNDTTLNIEEYRYLYYGFSFQNGYSAYGSSKYNDELEKVFEKKDLTDADREKIIVLEKKVLTEYPFNLRNLNTLINVMEQQGDTVAAILQIKKLVGVANAIISTGDGKSEETPMYVISVEHEYDMIGMLGYRPGGQQSLLNTKSGSMDKLALQENNGGIKNMYFNIDRLFANMQKTFKKN
jgi:hypothetical protein